MKNQESNLVPPHSSEAKPHTRERDVTLDEFQNVLSEKYGINGGNPEERMTQLCQLSNEGIAIMLEDINMMVTDSPESRMSHDSVIQIGPEGGVKQSTLPIESRYQVFTELIDGIREHSRDINPARAGDTLALGLLLLHPFEDGNGRTARVVGLIFNEAYDADDADETFEWVAGSRDKKRKEGSRIPFSYIPLFSEEQKQSNPDDVRSYLHKLLTEDNPGFYRGLDNQQTPLRKT